MGRIEELNFFDLVQFMVVKYFYIKIVKQIQIHLVPIVPDGHHKVTFLIKKFYFFS